MRRTITTLALAGALMLTAIPSALANSDNSQGTAGAGTEDCRPGAGNDLVGSWTPMTKIEYITDVADRYGIVTDPSSPDFDADRYQRLLDAAQATWDFCDKNLDGTLCVMTTVPSPYFYTLLDNRPFKG